MRVPGVDGPSSPSPCHHRYMDLALPSDLSLACTHAHTTSASGVGLGQMLTGLGRDEQTEALRDVSVSRIYSTAMGTRGPGRLCAHLAWKIPIMCCAWNPGDEQRTDRRKKPLPTSVPYLTPDAMPCVFSAPARLDHFLLGR
jgi:hypothetical protein